MQFKPQVAAALFLLAGFVVLPTALAQKGTIGSVEVVGNQTTDKNLILSVASLHTGNQLEYEDVQNAIRAVYGLQLFSDVQILSDAQGEVVNLKLKVVEFPRIGQIVIEGNKKLKEGDILAALSLKEGELASPSQVQNGLTQILDLYRQKGYPLIEIETDPVPQSATGLSLHYKINEGPKVKLKHVYVTGSRVFSESKLRGKLKLKIDKFEEKFQEGKQNLLDFYRDEGYIDATIVRDTTWYSPDQKYMFVMVQVSEGSRYDFGKVTIEGEKLFSEEILLGRVKFKPGQIYSQKKVEESLLAMEELYFEQGHIFVQLQDQVQTDSQTINLHLTVNEGVAAHVNLISIEGNTKTKEKVIRRELFLKPGDLFRRSLLMRSIRNVMVLNYFSNAVPNYEVLPNGDVNLSLKVEEKASGQISFGAGYSERDKVIGTIALGIPNLFGNGQSADINWEFGKRRNSFEFSFTEPWFKDTPTSVGFDVYRLDQRWYSDFTERKDGFSLRLGKRLSWPDNFFRLFGRYRIERILYKDFSSSYLAESLADSLNQYKTLNEIDWPRLTSAVDATLLRDSRDLAQFATRGSVVSLNVEFSGSVLGGDWNYLKEVLELRKYKKLIGNIVLAGMARYGVIDSWETNVDDNIPFSERFSPGGIDPDGMIRGYPDGWVGPKTPQGQLLLGRAMAVYNLEIQIPVVTQQIYGILFSDAGNSWASRKDMQPFRLNGGLYKSAGAGVRLIIPGLGTIGFDYGYGFDYTGNDKGRIHFQFGQRF